MSIIQAILLSDSSSDEEDDEADISEVELQNMLRLHKYQRKHQMQFYQDPEVSFNKNTLETHDKKDPLYWYR